MDPTLYTLHKTLEESYWWFVAKNEILMRLVRHFAPVATHPKALDVGCGTGGLLNQLSKEYQAQGIEMEPAAIDACRQRGLRVDPGSLPDDVNLPDGSFDVIIASEVLEHIENDAGAMARLVQILRPGGIFLCTVPAHMWLWSSHDEFNHHHRRYTRAQLGSLLDNAGLTRTRLSYQMVALFPVLAAGRLIERISGNKPASATIRPLPTPINWAMKTLYASEKWHLPFISSPVGASLVAVAIKPPRTSPPHAPKT